jgi:hypothetical protein
MFSRKVLVCLNISIQAQCSCAEDDEHFRLKSYARSRKAYTLKRQRFCVYAFKLSIQRLAGEPLNGKFFCAAWALVLEASVLPAHGTNSSCANAIT